MIRSVDSVGHSRVNTAQGIVDNQSINGQLYASQDLDLLLLGRNDFI